MTTHDLLRSLVFVPVFFGIPAVVWLLRRLQRETHLRCIVSQMRDYESLKAMRSKHLAGYKKKLLYWETQSLYEADDTSTYFPFINLYRQAIATAQADIDDIDNKITDLWCKIAQIDKKG